jgi:protein subunit release factor A
MKQLLFSVTKKDLKIETFRSGGKGGQHQNKTETGVRIRHADSGAIGESREERSQRANMKKAFVRLIEHPQFKSWHKIKTAMMLAGIRDVERELNKIVEEQMSEKNLKIEYFTP